MSNFDFSSIVYDSRKAGPGCAFFCLRGLNFDGHKYAQSAYDKGCRTFYVEEKLDLPFDANQVIVNDTRIALREVSADFFGHPEKEITIIGVTGTKGKTTIATLVCDLFNKCGLKTASIGTIGIVIDGIKYPTSNTTPESYVLYESFRKMVDCGTKYCIMEVSSQAYKVGRVEGITFDTSIFTNLSPDHIGVGEHPTFDDYKYCKSLLFKHSRNAIINIDDEHANYMINSCDCPVVTYGINSVCDLKAQNITQYRDSSVIGTAFEIDDTNIVLPIPGEYSVSNALAVIAVAKHYGLNMQAIKDALLTSSVCGRFEIVKVIPNRTFIIDYAHNEFSLQNVLETIKTYNPKRLVCLFGSVGDRTQLRRPKMGAVASLLCDFAIITSDNPGFEDPENIMKDIVDGFQKDIPHVCIADRRKAIEYAVKNSLDGDVILLAGKGHEDYQLIKDKKEHFSEREEVLKYKSI